MSKRQWEYTQARVQWPTDPRPTLTKMGKDGWELATAVREEDHLVSDCSPVPVLVLFFKRAVTPVVR